MVGNQFTDAVVEVEKNTHISGVFQEPWRTHPKDPVIHQAAFWSQTLDSVNTQEEGL